MAKGRRPDQFHSVVATHGVARNNKFECVIGLPVVVEKLLNPDSPESQSAFSKFVDKASSVMKKVTSITQKILGTGNPIDRTIGIMAESVQLPGFALEMGETKHNRMTRKLPTGATFEELNIVFTVSADMWEKIVFDQWMNAIYDRTTSQFEYFDNYKSDIYIKQLDNRQDVVHSIKVVDCFPSVITPLESDRSNQNEYHKLQVTFAYHYWEYDDTKEELPNPLEDPAGFAEALLDNGTVNKVYDFVTTGEANFTGEGLAVYNQVSKITTKYAGVSPNKANKMLNKVKSDLGGNSNIGSDAKDKLTGLIDNITDKL